MNIAKQAALTVTAAGLAVGASSGAAVADAHGDSAAVGSPGVASGLDAEVPVGVPLTAQGLSAHLIALLNPTFGNITANR